MCYMLEHALARKRMLIDFFFQIWSTTEVFFGGSTVNVAVHF